MNQLDVYYRALLEYRKLTSDNREAESFCRAVWQSDAQNDILTVKTFVCEIDEEWVKTIEDGIEHIARAIDEQRQFIRSNGEVVPIEKVKHITKESVEHLAKHSDLITREQKEDEIIPDKLYNVERLNDYTVYENRFLYMLLCYLRDFITVRYDKILELSARYEGELTLEKEISHGNRKISYNVKLSEIRKDDVYLMEHNASKAVIDRISLILKSVLSFLSTPLMEYAAKAPKLKPPITKTNVLKMDKHFKKTVELYDYIIAYDKAGYTVREKKRELAPFREELGKELSEACAMLSFLTYEYGLDIKSELKSAYEREELRRKEDTIANRALQIENLKRRMKNSELDVDEYLYELEKQIKLLESERARLQPMQDAIDSLRVKENELRETINGMREENHRLSDELDVIEEKHAEAMSEQKSAYEQRLREEFESFEKKKDELIKKCNSDIEAMRTRIKETRTALESEISALRISVSEKQNEFEALREEYDVLEEEKRVVEARFKGLRAEKGMIHELGDFSDKKSFDELEMEFAAFTRFYDKQWGKTKKKIRKELLDLKKLKGQDSDK